MREIKFRAWNIQKKEFNNSYLHLELNGELLSMNYSQLDGYESNVSDLYILMQFTGLHDKNGIEIYDKCVLNKKTTFDNNMSDKRFQLDTQINVGFENGCFVDKNTGVSLYDKMMTITSYPRKTWTEYEIVGTELENPELL